MFENILLLFCLCAITLIPAGISCLISGQSFSDELSSIGLSTVAAVVIVICVKFIIRTKIIKSPKSPKSPSHPLLQAFEVGTVSALILAIMGKLSLGMDNQNVLITKTIIISGGSMLIFRFIVFVDEYFDRYYE